VFFGSIRFIEANILRSFSSDWRLNQSALKSFHLGFTLLIRAIFLVGGSFAVESFSADLTSAPMPKMGKVQGEEGNLDRDRRLLYA
jgi:hypothetical protein